MKNVEIQPIAVLADSARLALDYEVSEAQIAEMRSYEVTVANNSDRDVKLERIELFRQTLDSKTIEIFRQGFYMPSDPVGFHLLTPGEKPATPGGWKKKHLSEWELISHSMTVLSIPGNVEKILFGFTTFNNFEGYFVFNTNGESIEISAWCDIEGIVLKQGESLKLETFVIKENTIFNLIVNDYTDHIASVNNARVLNKTVTGWIDWQYYREEKCEADALRTMEGMKKLRSDGYPLKYIVIDGGWCDFASEWLAPCDKFPSGMKEFSRILRKNGFELGLWLAPYLTNVNTNVAQEHPEWMVIDKQTGKPLYRQNSNVGPCNVLDFTVPEAMEWMRGIVRIMVEEWEIGYLKLDGPNMAHYEGGVLHDPQVTTIRQMRDSLKMIREECGDAVIIEGEGIYGPSIGFVDTQRTTQDNHPYWYFPDSSQPCMKENMKNDLLSGFTHRRLWHNHRENVVVRDFLSPHHHRKDENGNLKKDLVLPENELFTQLTATALAGGAMLLTDPLEVISRIPNKCDLISKFLPHHEGMSAEPVDMFKDDGEQPNVYAMRIDKEFESWSVIGLFNWDDEYRDIRIPASAFKDNETNASEYHFFEFWESLYHGCFNGDTVIRDVPAHGCRLFAVRRNSNVPQLVGTDMHLLQGAVDVSKVEWRNNELNIDVAHFNQKDKTLFIHHPDNYKLKDIKTNAKDHLADTRIPNLLKIHFNGNSENHSHFSMEINKIES